MPVFNLSFFDVYVVGSSKKAEQSSHPLIKTQKNKDINAQDFKDDTFICHLQSNYESQKLQIHKRLL